MDWYPNKILTKATQQLLKVYFEDIFKILESETSLKLNESKGMLTTNLIEIRLDFILIPF